MGNKPLIHVNNVSQVFTVGDQKIHPIKEVSFSLDENSFNIIYGPSGSGKSTLLNILSGLQAPTEGSVTIGGKDIYKFDRDALANFRAEEIGFIYQTNYWVKSLTVLDNVAMSLFFAGISRRKAAKLALQSLATVHMESYAKKYPTFLSGGEQQRIATARALATNPAFIIADEPTGSLDSENGDMIMNLLRSCQVDLKRTVILVTHNMEYLPLAEKLIHIEDGRVKEMEHESIQTTTETIFDNMKKRIRHLSELKKSGQ